MMIHRQFKFMCMIGAILLSLACSALAVDQPENINNSATESGEEKFLSPEMTPAVDIDMTFIESGSLIDQYGLYNFGVVVFPDKMPEMPDEWRELSHNYSRASVDFENSKFKDSREQIEMAIEGAPDSEYLYIRLAWVYINQGENQSALEALNSGLEKNPDSLYLRYYKARILESQRDLLEATTVYEDILTSYPNHIDTLTNLADVYFRSGKNRSRTKEICNHILELDGRNYTALLLMGTLESLESNMDEATSYFERAIRRRSWENWRILSVAKILERRMMMREALSLYTLLMKHFPDNDEIRKRWEELVIQADGEEGLLAAFEKLIEENPTSNQLYSVYAQYLVDHNYMEKALEVYKQLQNIQPDNNYVTLLEGFDALRKDDVNAARKKFDEYLSTGGDDFSPTPYIQTAIFYSQFGHDELAEQVLERAVKVYGKDDQAIQLALAELKQKNKDYDQAVKIYENLVEANPNIGAYRAMLGRALSMKGDMEEALVEMGQAHTMALPSPRYLLDTLLIALDLGKTDYADEMTRNTFKTQGTSDEKMRVALVAAAGFNQFGMIDETTAWADEALSLSPYNVNAQSMMIFSEIKQSKNYTILKEYPKFIGKIEDPQIALTHKLNLANLYIVANQTKEAVKELEGLKKDYPDNVEIAKSLVIALASMGKADKSISLLDSLQLPEDSNDYILTKVEIYRELRDYDSASELLIKYHEKNILNLESYLKLGALYQDMKKYDEAEELYIRALNLFPFNYDVLNNYAYLLAVRGIRLDKAENMASLALRLNPGAGYIIDTLAWIQYKRGLYSEAINLLNTAWSHSLPQADIAVHIGEVYLMLNEGEKAKEFFTKALTLDPESEDAKSGLKELE